MRVLVRRTVSTSFRVVSFGFTASAGFRWQRFGASRSHALIAFSLYLVAPYVLAVIPWYNVLGFDAAITQAAIEGLAIEHGLALNGTSAALLNDSLVLDGMRDAATQLKMKKDSRAYRYRVATDATGGVAAVSLALAPALMGACKVWKSLVPQSSLWGFGLRVLPFVALFNGIACYALAVQITADFSLMAFILIASGSSLWYTLFLRHSSSEKLRGSDQTASGWRSALSRATYASLGTLVLGYGALGAWVVTEYMNVAENRICAMGLTPQSLPPHL